MSKQIYYAQVLSLKFGNAQNLRSEDRSPKRINSRQNAALHIFLCLLLRNDSTDLKHDFHYLFFNACTHLCVFRQAGTLICIKKIENNLSYHSSGAIHHFPPQDSLSLSQNSLSRLGKMFSEPQGTMSLPPQPWDYKHATAHSFYFDGVLGFKLRFLTFSRHTVISERSPQFLHDAFFGCFTLLSLLTCLLVPAYFPTQVLF